MSATEAVTTTVPVRVVQGSAGQDSTWVEDRLGFDPVPGLSGAAAMQAVTLGTGQGTLFRFPAGFVNNFHTSPEPTWMLFVAGRLEVTTSDGTSVVLHAGDVVRFEDASGPGHRSRVVSDEDVLVVTVPATA